MKWGRPWATADKFTVRWNRMSKTSEDLEIRMIVKRTWFRYGKIDCILLFVCLFVCFIYLVLKHSYQGLVKNLDGNERKYKI